MAGGNPATVVIRDCTSTGPTYTNVTAIRFKHADNATADANNPMVKPSAGNYDRSYIKTLQLYTADGPTNNITNGKFYCGTNTNNGLSYYAYAYNGAYAQYGGMGSATDATATQDASYTANPTSGASVNYLTTTFTGTGQIGYFVRVYARVDSTVNAPGTLSNVALIFSYDET